jgi:nucleotide-binding universal stress UspA family protein
VTNVLLAIDGSFYGKIISDFVVNHLWASRTQFKLVNVIDPLADDVYPEASFECAASDAAKALLQEMTTRIHLALPDSDVSQLIRHGDPKEELLKEATEWPANLLVLGSHGCRDLKRVLLGSVSLSVMTSAPCTVILVRVPQKNLEAIAAASARLDAAKNLRCS